ncbi:MAG: hypothetical protein CMJ76_12685 [Planctomycetaceae bacterium]|nr:hypothetical protein [Planctomycetaceae bacterium]|tara:strand:- start:1580 stop:2872 length:1293 start_codon:yes stop_codon:yes gene_type:complete
MKSLRLIFLATAVLFAGFYSFMAFESDATAETLQDKKKSAVKSPADLETIKSQIEAAVKAGKITEQQAKQKYQQLFGDKLESAKQKPVPEKKSVKDTDQFKSQIEAALKAGEITEAQAKEKYEALYGKKPEADNEKDSAGKAKGSANGEYAEFIGRLAKLVESGKLTKQEAIDLYNSVVRKKVITPKKGVNGTDYKINSLDEQKRLQNILPLTSTGDDKEGPVACGFFGWAADATHRFMDNSHKGEARPIHGLSFRLDYRDHDTIGRTWDNITLKIAHGNWGSIKYNASKDFELLDEQTTVFSKEWTFPTLKGYPALKPAEWGGPQNCLNFQFDKPFLYNGKDAIYVEFIFSGGKTEDGRNWEGDLPYGFEYFLDSMQQKGGWRMAGESKGLYLPPRVEAVVSYTAGGQSVWTSSAKGMPYLNWDFRKAR